MKNRNIKDKVEFTIEELEIAIYEGLNNLDFAMSNDEIEDIQNLIFRELKIKYIANWRSLKNEN